MSMGNRTNSSCECSINLYIGKIATLQLIYVTILVCARKAVTEIHSCAINCLNQIHILAAQDTYA